MRVVTTILFLFILTSCYNKLLADNSTRSDSAIVDSIYGKGIWISYFQTIYTPLGKAVKLKIINDSSYVIQWGDSLKFKTYPDTFCLDGHETWLPYYITENKNYIVLRKGCGNPCWIGYFLPLVDSLTSHAICEYLDFDLENNLVASVKASNVIEIINLKTNLIENHMLKECLSAFPGYCIDSLSIKNKILKYKWIPETVLKSKQGTLIIEKINI